MGRIIEPELLQPIAVPAGRWSTSAVPPASRLEYWVGAVCDAYLPAECSCPVPERFEGLLEAVQVGALAFSRLQSTGHTTRTLAGSGKDVFYLVSDRRFSWTVRQNGYLRQYRPGDLALIDAREPHEAQFRHGASFGAVELPVSWLRRYLRAIDALGPRAAARDAGWGRVLSSLCGELAADLDLVHHMPGDFLVDHLGGLLSACFEPPTQGPPERAQRDLKARAEQVLRQRLVEPGLTAAAVAGELGVSVRSLHRAFAAAGSTFAGSLRDARLKRAMDLLGRPGLDGVSVAEIGVRCGFRDPSHFSRAFRRHNGASPTSWRQQPGT